MGLFFIFHVRGSSMEPFAREDDYVCVRKFFPWEKPRENDTIVASDPRDSSRLLFKRIARIHDGGYTVLGDNKKASTDSRIFGSVSRENIQGKVIARIGHK